MPGRSLQLRWLQSSAQAALPLGLQRPTLSGSCQGSPSPDPIYKQGFRPASTTRPGPGAALTC